MEPNKVTIDNKVYEYKDVIHHTTVSGKFNFAERLAILFGKDVIVRSKIYCKNKMVIIVASEAYATVEPLIKHKLKTHIMSDENNNAEALEEKSTEDKVLKASEIPTEEGTNVGTGEVGPKSNQEPAMDAQPAPVNEEEVRMLSYIGTKAIKAKPMTRGAYNEYRGWEMPANEDASEMVYLVEYAPDPLSPPNHPDHAGYISMSPKHVFEEAYKIAETYKDRLMIETLDLRDRMTKLKAALDGGKVPATEIPILNEQYQAMNNLYIILNKRLGRA